MDRRQANRLPKRSDCLWDPPELGPGIRSRRYKRILSTHSQGCQGGGQLVAARLGLFFDGVNLGRDTAPEASRLEQGLAFPQWQEFYNKRCKP